MIITIHIDPSWLSHPESLGRILGHVRALEAPAPWAPPATRQPGDDDDLGQLLDGIDSPEPAQAPAPKPSPPAARPFDGIPTTGQALYRWSCDRKVLPKVNAIGKDRGWPKLVTQWDADQVAAAYRELTSQPVANGRHR